MTCAYIKSNGCFLKQIIIEIIKTMLKKIFTNNLIRFNLQIKDDLNVKFSQFIYWGLLGSFLLGILLFIMQTIGLDTLTINSKPILVIKLINYMFFQVVIISAILVRTVIYKNKLIWLAFLGYIVVHSTIYCLILQQLNMFYYIYLSVMGIILFVFLHSISISKEQVGKLTSFCLIVFKVAIFCAFAQLVLDLRLAHYPRLDSIFSDYNDFSSYLISIIPLLYVLNRKKSILISIVMILLAKSTTSIMVLIFFIIFYLVGLIKKKKYFLKLLMAFIGFFIMVLVFLISTSAHDVLHPKNPVFKIRQAMYIFRIDNIVLMKKNMDEVRRKTSEEIIGIEYSSSVQRGMQIIRSLFGWDSAFELLFGFRSGWSEGIFLLIFIRFGLIGVFVFGSIYYKFYIKKTHSYICRCYLLALFIGAGFALPMLSFSVSSFFVATQIYCMQRILDIKQLHQTNVIT